MDIYLDTNIWNELFKQGVHPGSLLSSFAGKRISLVLSDETAYELAKIFAKKGHRCLQGGIGLFTYLKEFITRSVPITGYKMDA
jgi:predicted nucleic acid-binding protein